MAHFLPQSSNFPLEEQIKTLADDELLDFWEEAQHLEKFLGDEMNDLDTTVEYERLILLELQFRSCRRSLRLPA
ncbi:hypothetical protein [Desulfovibrio ferrophilus]|uniref:Uncharacterized protein n=1 Tax=Desulfovibrio ferrophilus TaxID=241368 RepID=A0A2Z6AWJ3_9BACT|nr:hypothetical protein [Desulfovibrio ferrophilus]BBD07614.1 uncharacterized protein DFE_0888 [Desulfovibrio ferrophilus]